MSNELPFPAAAPRMAAGALILDHRGNVLLVKPTYKDGWDIPGGYVEQGESPAQACSRELLEELGLSVDVGRLLVVDWAPHPAEGDKVLWIFDGGMISSSQANSLILQPEEIGDAKYWSSEDFSNLMADRLARRLRLAIGAVRESRSIYAENGLIPQPQLSDR